MTQIHLPVIGTGSTLTRSVLKLKLASDETDTGVLRAPGDRGTPTPGGRASVAAAAAAAAVDPPVPIASKHTVKKFSPSSMVIADVASQQTKTQAVSSVHQRSVVRISWPQQPGENSFHLASDL